MSRRSQFSLKRAGRFFPPLGQTFVSIEALSGIALLVAAIAALVWANAAPGSYDDLWHQSLTLGAGDVAITLDLRHWINEAVMTVFFFVVGLEIKREVVDGELSDARTASLPVLAAVGGMALPALLYVAFNAGGDGSRGWGIPMATDIAFAVGVLALLGARVRKGLKLFLLTLAIVDDIGAILVIAIFYSEGVEIAWLLGAAGVVATLLVASRLRISPWLLYPLPAVALWVCTHEAGIHATLSGVVLALLIRAEPGRGRGPLERLEDAVHPWSSFAVVPLFALANAGVVLSADAIDRAAGGAIATGIVVGLVVGKVLGIAGLTALGLKLRLGRLPRGVEMPDVVGVAAVAGIGFTVSLFVADLSFDGARLEQAKVGILAASVLAGALGTWMLARRNRTAAARHAAARPST